LVYLSGSCDKDITHRKFYPQFPTAVSSAESSNNHSSTSWPHCAW